MYVTCKNGNDFIFLNYLFIETFAVLNNIPMKTL